MNTMTMGIIVLSGSFIFMLLMGVEIAYSLGLAAVFTCLFMDINLLVVFQAIFYKMANYSLLAVPCFMLMGEFMSIGSMATNIVGLANVLVGWMPGGLAMVNVVDSMFFGGISGSAVADVSSIGSIVIRLMKEAGYDEDFSVALTCTSSIQGIIIPPSHNLVIYAVTAGGVSIAALYMGGYLSGIMLGLCLAVYCFIVSKRRKYPVAEPFKWSNFVRALWKSLPAIGCMIVVVGGVLFGWMTATESAAAACVYCFIFTFVIERAGTRRDLYEAFSNTIKTIGSVLILAACATAFSWVITYLRIPQIVTAGLFSITENKILMLLIINGILLIMGMFMNMVSIIYIMVPILLPVITKLGMHPVQFGIMLILNLGVGLLTPPVGQVLFVGCSVGNISMERLTKALLPQLAFMGIALVLITFWPPLTMWLPRAVGYIV
ncbi:MAG: Sialic acid TRAP transporter permease protein SiaT [Spirochaetes bacterium ADurb.Bin315]|jgi:tripartite ATP-independent transporter DctM subunit|nr:MAG: Sialic acid TRAP transporter permease protein SiaT [Spirochaetes bacterium ADurb.Bin315]